MRLARSSAPSSVMARHPAVDSGGAGLCLGLALTDAALRAPKGYSSRGLGHPHLAGRDDAPFKWLPAESAMQAMLMPGPNHFLPQTTIRVNDLTAGEDDTPTPPDARRWVQPSTPNFRAAWQCCELAGGNGQEFWCWCWCAFGIRWTGESGLRFDNKFRLSRFHVPGGCLSLRHDRVAAAHFTGQCTDSWQQAKLPLRASKRALIACSRLWPRRKVQWRDKRPVAEQQPGLQKLTDCTPITEPPAPSPGAVVRVAGGGKVVDDAPEANRHRAALAHGVHDLWGERVLNACRRERINLRSVDRGDDYVDHDVTTRHPGRQLGQAVCASFSQPVGPHDCLQPARPRTSNWATGRGRTCI